MSTYSGLSSSDAAFARRVFSMGVNVCMRHAAQLHYTKDEGPRWEGINKRVIAVKHGRGPRQYGKPSPLIASETGKLLQHGDCSSTGTWLLWQALYLPFRLPDRVNGTGWRSGWTGTLRKHGRTVSDIDGLKIGDAVIYGTGDGDHVAWAVGGGRLFSHGQEAGPYLVDDSYRSGEILVIKRYI